MMNEKQMIEMGDKWRNFRRYDFGPFSGNFNSNKSPNGFPQFLFMERVANQQLHRQIKWVTIGSCSDSVDQQMSPDEPEIKRTSLQSHSNSYWVASEMKYSQSPSHHLRQSNSIIRLGWTTWSCCIFPIFLERFGIVIQINRSRQNRFLSLIFTDCSIYTRQADLTIIRMPQNKDNHPKANIET